MSQDHYQKQTLEEKFCLFHKGLINVGVAENSCHDCIKNSLSQRGLSIKDPENVTLYPAGNLGILIRMIGAERWHVIRDDPQEILRMIETIDFFEKVQPGCTLCRSDVFLNITI